MIKVKESLYDPEELARKYFVALYKDYDKTYNIPRYFVMNDGYFVKNIIADSDEEAIRKFNAEYRKGSLESKSRKVNGRKRINEGHTEDGYMGATKWVGDKSHLSLYGKDLSSAIRQDLKDNGISGCTVRTSRGNSVTVTVKGKDSDKISYNEFKNSDWYKDVFYYGYAYINGEKISERDFYNMSANEQDEIRKQVYEQEIVNKKEYQINHYYLDDYNTYFTNSFINKLKKINSILAEFQYDDSNAMVDYFNTNMYYSIYAVF